MMFSANPARIISPIFMSPLENTIALGGVATGIMKAQLAAIAAGMVSNNGDISWESASAPKSGRKAAVVAVLLVTSVRKMITATTSVIITIKGMALATPIDSAI